MIGLFVNRQRDSSGGVTLTPRPAAGIPVTARGQGLQGWAVASDGSSYSEELGSTPVPSTAIRSQGLAFTPDGALYTTVSAPTSTSAKIGGFAVRADGALHLADSNTVGATIQGIKVTADGRLITSAPWTLSFVTRYWDSRQGVTSSGERASNWLDMKLGTDLAQASGAAQPILLPYAGVNYLWLAGVAGNYASAPNSAPLRITGTIEFIAELALDDWTPAATTTITAKEATATTRSYHWGIATSGAIYFTLSEDGTNTIIGSSSSATGFTDLSYKFIKTTWNQTTKDVKHYTSSDGVSWTQLGTTQTINITAIYESPDPLEVGTRRAGTAEFLGGKIRKLWINNGIDGTSAFYANFTAVAEGATSFTESSANAATVTINSTGSKPAQIVGRQSIITDGVAHFMRASYTQAQPHTRVALFKKITEVMNGAYLAGGVNDGASIYANTSTTLSLWAGGGPACTINLATGELVVIGAVFNGSSSSLQKGLNAPVTGNPSTNTSGGMTIGADGAVTNEYSNTQYFSIADCAGALSAAQLNQLIRAMAAQGGVSV